jgi:hypothetical protein
MENVVMDSTTKLYLLIFPEHGIVKVGKADDINNRVQSLRRWWGDVDYESSYYLTAPEKVVFKLEKSLHFLLSSFSVSFEEGDGRTELFSEDALDVAIKHIDLYCSASSDLKGLKKGIPRPVLPAASKRRRRNKYTKYSQMSKTLARGVSRIAAKFDYINRLLVILLKRQSRIPYQYDIVDQHVVFRIRLPISHDRLSVYDNLVQQFSFDIKDFNGWLGVHCCEITAENDVIQFNIRLKILEDDRSLCALFSYFTEQSEFLLNKLPKCSPATIQPIPILDETRVLGEILQKFEEDGC